MRRIYKKYTQYNERKSMGDTGSDRVVLTVYKWENMKKKLCDTDHIYWYLSARILFYPEAEFMKVQFRLKFLILRVLILEVSV